MRNTNPKECSTTLRIDKKTKSELKSLAKKSSLSETEYVRAVLIWAVRHGKIAHTDLEVDLE